MAQGKISAVLIEIFLMGALGFDRGAVHDNIVN